jgi:RNA polymerase sigma-70 factor (ECF subfamily)
MGDGSVTHATANRARLRSVFDEHFEAVSRYCHRRLPSADANDATAQVFAVAWRKIESMPPGSETLPWLYGVARNEVRTLRRSVRRIAGLRTKLSGQASYPEPGPETVVIRNSEQARLLEALAKLHPDDQEVLRLRAYEDLSFPEIAIVLGCSVDAAKKRSSRAIKRLRAAAGLPGPQVASSGSRVIQEGGDR